MGWRWRKTFYAGPFRTTLSRRGWGWSFGLPFLRYGVGPTGRAYVSIGIPGTGLYFTKLLGRTRDDVERPMLPERELYNSEPHSLPMADSDEATNNQKILAKIKKGQ